MASRTVHANCTGSFSFYVVILSFFCFLSACQTVTEETLRANVLDAAINTAVKSKILADPLVSTGEVSVETVRGHVYLRGVVRKADDKRRAQELANEVPGGLTVVNQLKIQEIQNL
jgi:osmotically-inducible protein OsmY